MASIAATSRCLTRLKAQADGARRAGRDADLRAASARRLRPRALHVPPDAARHQGASRRRARARRHRADAVQPRPEHGRGRGFRLALPRQGTARLRRRRRRRFPLRPQPARHARLPARCRQASTASRSISSICCPKATSPSPPRASAPRWRQGDVAAANGMLGYHWFFGGEVVKGDQRGRELGFPTANIATATDLRAGAGRLRRARPARRKAARWRRGLRQADVQQRAAALRDLSLRFRRRHLRPPPRSRADRPHPRPGEVRQPRRTDRRHDTATAAGPARRWPAAARSAIWTGRWGSSAEHLHIRGLCR